MDETATYSYDPYYNQLAKQSAEAYHMMANTVNARLDRQIESAEQQLANAKRAKEILARNPEIEELLNLLQKGLL